MHDKKHMLDQGLGGRWMGHDSAVCREQSTPAAVGAAKEGCMALVYAAICFHAPRPPRAAQATKRE
jgi:hypothetical protein